MTVAGRSGYERRFVCELRAAQGRRLAGYAATFGTEARIGGFVEVIRPGAFARTLRAGSDILALADHSPVAVLGRTKSGTLRLSEDQRGLAFELDVADTSRGNDILALAQRGDLGGMSFGFKVAPNGERWSSDRARRELLAVELREISVVSAWPAYENTSVQARARQPGLVELGRYLELIH